MAKYTIELGQLIKNNFPLGLADYPIFNEEYRRTLNNKIIEHFYFREIGFETPQLFKRFLNRKLAEIMPYYNKLYETELLEYDPLTNYNRTEVTNRGEAVQNAINSSENGQVNDSGNGSNQSSGSSSGKSVYSDTPQGFLQNTDIDANTYASSADKSQNTTSSSGSNSYQSARATTSSVATTGSTNTTENITKSITGKDGSKSFAELIQEYRNTLLNIDMLIIDELEPLFMGIW